jgi:type III restriction enzyme
VQRYLKEKVKVLPPANAKDLFLAPYYGWVVEGLLSTIGPDTSQGEAPEIPRYEANRDPGSTGDVDFWTSKPVFEVVRSHLNYVVADTKVWEQSAAFTIDRHPAVESFAKNASLGFAIPYLHNGQTHDYVPDFLVKLIDGSMLVLETKGYDPLEGTKRDAAERWVRAVNADGNWGTWRYALVKRVSDVESAIVPASSRGARTWRSE